eukprot:NODE_7363_length_1586_cov_3.975326.p1 GENE.NODE_7363_length_1586_cov_3.975326~~NODE_7363_length_1586_cov_3.975326.p1  ORF type:complete len:478 (+),score=141.98 NODE_7363_length_1586_cov_3.975326:77-1510(+)
MWASRLIRLRLPLPAAALAACATYTLQTRCRCEAKQGKRFDAVVIGGGVIGLAVARELSVSGASVCLLEKEPVLAAGVTSGSSGLGHTGYDAPADSLERRLLRNSLARHQELYRSLGLSHAHIRKRGSLVVAWDAKDSEALPEILAEAHRAGDTEAELLSHEALMEIEPALSPAARGAVLLCREAVAEPWLVPMGFAESARLHGADIRVATAVVSAERDAAGDWRVGLSTGDYVTGGVVVNCAGLFASDVEALGPRAIVPFKVHPRKGQCVVLQPAEGVAPHFIIEPVPSQFTKGILLWETLYGQVVVGPTAEDQSSKTDRSTDSETIARLVAHGERMVPGLRGARVLSSYSGLRPATEFRDYQISYAGEHWITVGGIRSTGLSCATGIAEYVSQLYREALSGLQPSGAAERALKPPYPAEPLRPAPRVANAAMPSLPELAANFQRRSDGQVELFGRPQHVTHPISSLGMANWPLED